MTLYHYELVAREAAKLANTPTANVQDKGELSK
jgi:hypothetical protein